MISGEQSLAVTTPQFEDMDEVTLEQAEAIIHQGRETFVEVGKALLAIRERRGYRLRGFSNFDDYCRSQWGFGYEWAYKQIESAKVASNLDMYEGITTSKAAILAPLAPEEQKEMAAKVDIAALTVRELRTHRREFDEELIRRKTETPGPKKADAATNGLPGFVSFLPCVIEQADAAELPLEDEAVDLIVTSPPYGLGKDYPGSNDDAGYQIYLTNIDTWAAEMFRVAAPNGRLCMNVPLDITRGGVQPVYADWVNALTNVGWHYRFTIIWNEGNIKRAIARGSIDSPVAPHVIAPVEVILVMHKGDWNLGRGGEHTLDHESWLTWTNGMWNFPGESHQEYPAAFPEELPRRCISLLSFTDSIVCDPFCGSGTSAIAAARLGRSFYGYDVAEEAVELAKNRARRAGVHFQDEEVEFER